MRSLCRFLAATCVLLAGHALAQTPGATVVDVPTRPGVTQRFLLLTPAVPPMAVVLLSSGGNGGLQLSPNGEFRSGKINFLVRSRERFAAQGLAVAVIDAPSDRQAPPHLKGFRQTPEHAADVRAVIADLRARFGKPVVLIGTSRGTQSVASVALALREGGGPDAIVLTSTILWDRSSERPVNQLPVESLSIPVLLVHHQADSCRQTPPGEVAALAERLRSPHKVLIYSGGVSTGDPCEPWAHHGFNGLEDQVVTDVAAWVRENVKP